MDVLSIISSFHGSPLVYFLIFLIALVESIVLIGLAFPGTTMMVFIGFLCFRGQLDFGWSIFVLSFGGSIGDLISYYLGRSKLPILYFIEKKIRPDRLLKAEVFFTKYGASGVFLHRFIGALRPILPFAAGILKMPRQIFIPIDLLSNLLSAWFFVYLGIFFGHRWQFFLSLLYRFERLLVIALFLFVFGYYFFKKIKKRSS